jgi:hypothetical protein
MVEDGGRSGVSIIVSCFLVVFSFPHRMHLLSRSNYWTRRKMDDVADRSLGGGKSFSEEAILAFHVEEI